MTGDSLQLFCATDKEIYDALMSGKQRITDTVMRDLAADRGILYSGQDTRESLAAKLAMLPHDHYDLNAIVQQSQHKGRGEKTTSVVLPNLSVAEIKEIAEAYKAETKGEKVTSFQRGPDGFQVNVLYTEIDYSKTRLVQRREREASIEFAVQEDGKTVIRLPATDKSKQIVEELRTRIASKRQAEVVAERIELTALAGAGVRTEFFTQLITNVPDFSLTNVTSVRVESSHRAHESDLDYEEEEESADAEIVEQQMLSAVKNVALKGQSLLNSQVYQELRERGFYIVAIRWQARHYQDSAEYEFDAGFDEPEQGRGFKYGVLGVRRYEGGRYTKTLRPVDDDQRAYIFDLIERTARNILLKLREEATEENEPSDGEIEKATEG